MLAAGCGDSDTPAGDAPPGVVLELDGIQVTEAEISEYVDYILSVDKRTGKREMVRAILDQHILPVRLAQRAFAEQRQALRAQCEALAHAVGNGGYPALLRKGGPLVGNQDNLVLSRYELPLAIQRYAFDETRIGLLSPVIETPQGFSLVSVFNIERGMARPADRVEFFQVPFYVLGPTEFDAWLRQHQVEVAAKLTYVHPDYAEALPPWLQGKTSSP